MRSAISSLLSRRESSVHTSHKLLLDSHTELNFENLFILSLHLHLSEMGQMSRSYDFFAKQAPIDLCGSISEETTLSFG